PRPPQSRAASFMSLYRKRAYTACPCPLLAHSRFRYSPRTYQELSIQMGNGALTFEIQPASETPEISRRCVANLVVGQPLNRACMPSVLLNPCSASPVPCPCFRVSRELSPFRKGTGSDVWKWNLILKASVPLLLDSR